MPYIRATASLLPDRVVSNEEITSMLIEGSGPDTSAAEIEKALARGRDIQRKTGLRERRFFDPGVDPVDTTLSVVKALLKEGRLDWDQLDGLIVSTSSIHGFPGVSQQVLARAKGQSAEIKDWFVMDIGSNACTSFMYALGVADSFVRTGQLRNVAVVAVEFSSRCLDYSVRSFGISTLFGDAAAGVLMSVDDIGAARVESVRLSAYTDAKRISFIHGSGLEASDLQAPVPPNSRWYMSGPPVAIDAIEIIVSEVLRYRSNGTRCDWLIPHQGNLTRIMYPACDRLEVPRDRLLSSFETTGNTSSASIPLLLDMLMRSKTCRSDQDVLLVGFGASFSVGSAHLRTL